MSMEADWSVDVGAELPWIVVPWAEEPQQAIDAADDVAGESDGLPSSQPARFLSLFGLEEASMMDAIAEARDYPALARALVRLNAPGSPMFTSKCDVWELGAGEIDPLDFDFRVDNSNEPAYAAGGSSASAASLVGVASYVDLIFRAADSFRLFEWHEEWMRRTTLSLRETPLRSSRVELVLRPAEVFGVEGFGITLYVTGCGMRLPAAAVAWAASLAGVVDLILLEIQRTGDGAMHAEH